MSRPLHCAALLLSPVIALALFDAAYAADDGKQALCGTSEIVVFACRSGKKLVSVCASNDASIDRGYLQYRFGKPDAAIAPELTLPARQLLPAQAAHGENVAYAGGGGSWLRFRNGEHGYVVYTGIGRWGADGETMEKQGVQVEHNGDVVANLPCSGPLVSELGPEWFERMGINAAGEEFFFPE